jgi:hypothetical protein
VVDDMVDGVLAANQVPDADAARVRAVLTAALQGQPIEPEARAA